MAAKGVTVTYSQRMAFGSLMLIAGLGWAQAAIKSIDASHTRAMLEHTQSRYERCVLTTVSASVQIDRARRAWDAFNAYYGHVLVPVHYMEDE